MKHKCNNIIDTLNKSRGFDRTKYVRPRSAVFADRTKYNRKKIRKADCEE